MGMIGSMQYVDGSGVPVYGFWVPRRPSLGSRKGRLAYVMDLQEAGRREIDRPIETYDVEVEVLYVTRARQDTIDVDNLEKPTLDALKGVAYVDDAQVRVVRIAKFDKTRAAQISGRKGPLDVLWRDDSNPHAVWVYIYSMSRKTELQVAGVRRRPPGWKEHQLLSPWSPAQADS